MHKDERGYFCESYKADEFLNNGIDTKFVLELQSKSEINTFRGLHYQIEPYAQAKLVSVVFGKVLDIIVDLRRGSDTFLKYITLELSEEIQPQVYIPKGYAHGFLVLSELVVMNYKLDNYYSPECYTGINVFDKTIGISLPIEQEKLVISEKDKKLPTVEKALVFDKE